MGNLFGETLTGLDFVVLGRTMRCGNADAMVVGVKTVLLKMFIRGGTCKIQIISRF